MPFRTKVYKKPEGRHEYHLQYKGVFFWSTVDFDYSSPDNFSRNPDNRYRLIYEHQYDCEIAEGYANDGFINKIITEYKDIIDKRYL